MLRLLLVHTAGILCLLPSFCSGQEYGFYQPSGMNALLMVCVANNLHIFCGGMDTDTVPVRHKKYISLYNDIQ
jgi:hypothetical protein